MNNNVIAPEYLRMILSLKKVLTWSSITIIVAALIYFNVNHVVGIILGLFILPFVMMALFYNYKIAPRLKRLQEWQVPTQYTNQLLLIFPNSTAIQRQWIVEGFKDYIACHLYKNQHLAMPSYAVDQFWHILLEDPVAYRALCQKILGRELRHVIYDQNQSQMAAVTDQYHAFMHVWGSSCMVNQLHAGKTKYLPRLFAIDYILNLKNTSAASELEHNKSAYQQYLRTQNSDLGGGGSCSSCGGD